jgi:phosphomannomutase
MINGEIFHSYDIRGIYPTEINEEAALMIGRAFGQFIKSDIVIGCDMRLSSPALAKNFAQGVTEAGFNCIDLGLCTTPMLNFAVAHKKYKGGAIITASHNPSEYNGIKLIGEKAVQFNKDRGIKEIKELVGQNFQSAVKPGKIISENILGEYVDWVVSKVKDIRSFKFAVDYGNGVGSISARPVFAKLNEKPLELYSEPDGTYPNHIANPAEEENLTDLKCAIKENNCEFGFAFDGDADRAIFVDEHGNKIDPGFLLAAIATKELARRPREKIYYDLRFSKVVPKAIMAAQGLPDRTKVGNPYFKQKLILNGGLMAAEYSGHFMYQENYGIDDGLFSAVKVMYWLDQTGQKLSEFVGSFSKGYYLTGEINLEVKDSQKIIKILENKFSDAKIDNFDGVTIDYPDWWFNLRASNTEPVVRLNIEANSQNLLEAKKKEIIELIHQES